MFFFTGLSGSRGEQARHARAHPCTIFFVYTCTILFVYTSTILSVYTRAIFFVYTRTILFMYIIRVRGAVL